MSQLQDSLPIEMAWHEPPPAVRQGLDVPWLMFLGAWVVAGVVGVFLARAGEIFVAGAVVVPLTVIGAFWKPTFGVCLLLMSVPLERVISWGGIGFGRVVGIIIAMGLLPRLILFRQRRLHIPTPWGLVGLTILALLSITWAQYPEIAGKFTFTLFQLLVLIFLIQSFCTSTEDLRWPLRAFALTCLGMALLSGVLGLAHGTEGRLTFGMSQERMDNPNYTGCMFALGLFTAIYLFVTDRRATFLRWLWLLTAIVMPVVILMTGSRKALVSVAATLILPVLFLREVVRKPTIFVAVVVFGVVVLVGMYVGMEHFASKGVVDRLTDTEQARGGIETRLDFIVEGLDYLQRNPMGAGLGCYYTGHGHAIHNDLFYVTVNLGWLGGVAFVLLAVGLLVSVHRAEPGWEKWMGRSIIVFFLVQGLVATWILLKGYWVFLTIGALLVAASRRARTEADLVEQEQEYEEAGPDQAWAP